ncbi:MAG: diadenylate cyclase CdaA [Eubacteriales bacterium]|nr:diadenylate cyclase CdaA [Eubacteriales bacterium]
MVSFLEKIKSLISLLPPFGIKEAVETVIISFLIYEMISLLFKSRAMTLIKGILLILGFTLLCVLFRLETILFLLEKVSTIAVIAVVVIFQPELRSILEQLGKTSKIPSIIKTTENKDNITRETIEEIAKASFDMGRVKTGALIVIEKLDSLEGWVNTGIKVDGELSAALLINIFEKNTPLHDGAVVVRGNRVAAATCYLPLSENDHISKELGTRHRAAIGISEKTDSYTVVVSEETGNVSLAVDGRIFKMKNKEHLIYELKSLVKEEHGKGSHRFFKKKEEAEK